VEGVVVMELSVGGYSAEIERFGAVTPVNPQNYGSNVLVKQITTRGS
jgi:hypothetical protein